MTRGLSSRVPGVNSLSDGRVRPPRTWGAHIGTAQRNPIEGGEPAPPSAQRVASRASPAYLRPTPVRRAMIARAAFVRLLWFASVSSASAQTPRSAPSVAVDVVLPAARTAGPLDGRLLLLVSTDSTAEP